MATTKFSGDFINDGTLGPEKLKAGTTIDLPGYTELRAYRGNATTVILRNPGIGGIFNRDTSDTSSSDNGGTIIVAGAVRWKRFYSGALNVMWFGAMGDGINDDTAEIQAAVDLAGKGGTVIFPKTPANTYMTSAALKFYNGQTWTGSGGIDVSGLPTNIKLTANSTSVVEPVNPTAVTYGFNPIGLYFNAGNFAPCGLSLYNTSYAVVDQCCAAISTVGGAGFLLDSDTSKQCYFNILNNVRTFASGTGSVGIRFTRGANANQVIGGKCGSGVRGMEFLSLSSGNNIYGMDFENNTDRHIFIDAPNNNFFGIHLEACPVGIELTANGNLTGLFAPTFATSITTQIIDNSLQGARIDANHDVSGDLGRLKAGAFAAMTTLLASSTTTDIDLSLYNQTAIANLRFFRYVNTSGVKKITFCKGDGTANAAVDFDLSSGSILCGDITQGDNNFSLYRKLIRRSAIPTSGTYNSADRIIRNNSSLANPVTDWTCITTGTTGGTWQASGWVVGKGPTANRPNLGAYDIGVVYLDTTLAVAGKPIMWTGTQWVDYTGTVV